MNEETEIIDKLYLELSQFTTAKTGKEIELERENAELRRQLKVSEEIRTGEKKILIAEIGKNAELRRCLTQITEWNNGRTMDRDLIQKVFNRAEALAAGKGGKGK